ncbi:MAG: C-type lectin domain-containing protein, partial [Lachnospiraceae bacterium]|nr:C-type lectin domain-containing protein [Lachnospiraceae bacterium]
DLIPPGNLGIHLPRRAEDALFTALAVQASDRYQSMAEFQTAFEKGMTDTATEDLADDTIRRTTVQEKVVGQEVHFAPESDEKVRQEKQQEAKENRSGQSQNADGVNPLQQNSQDVKNNKVIIIGLSAAVGILLIIVISMAVQRGRSTGTEAAVNLSDQAKKADSFEESKAEGELTKSVQNDEAQAAADDDLPAQSEKKETEKLPAKEDKTEEDKEEKKAVEEKDEEKDIETKAFVDEGVNTYELIVADVTWTEAFNDCLDRGGHLVRITTNEEYQAILRQIYQEGKQNIKFYLAGTRDQDGVTYHWVYEDGSYSEESINYSSKYKDCWLENEPSFYDEATQSEENRMNMFYMKKTDKWVWNDVPDDILEVVEDYAGTIGYICEYE